MPVAKRTMVARVMPKRTAGVRSATKINRRARERVERRNQRQAEILDTARRIYATKGYEAMTLADIAAVLKFSKQALYYYFDSKESIFQALQEEGIKKLEELTPQPERLDPIENLRQPFWRFYEFSKAYPEYFNLLWVDPAAPAIDWTAPRFRRLVAMTDDSHRRVQRCIDEGLLPPTVDPAVAGSVLLAAVHGCAVIGLTGRPELGPIDVDTLAALLLDAAIVVLKTRH